MEDDHGMTIPILPQAAKPLRKFLDRHGYDPNEFAQIGISLAMRLVKEQEQGNTLVVMTEDKGQALGEIRIPEPGRFRNASADSFVERLIRVHIVRLLRQHNWIDASVGY